MRDKLEKLKQDLKHTENLPLLSKATMIPVLVRDLLSLIEDMINKLDEV